MSKNQKKLGELAGNETYDAEKYANKNPIMRFLLKIFINKLIAFIDETQATKILDAGCGEGHLLRAILEKREKLNIEGFDYSADLVGKAQKVNPTLNLSVNNIYDLPHEDNSYDLILCTQVLEHLEHPEKAINELGRITEKYCILSVPNEPYFRLAQFFRGKYIATFGNKPNHLNLWSARQFIQILKSHFEILQVVTPFPWTIVLCTLKNS